MSDIIVGSVGVRLVPNAEGFPEKVKALTKGLTADVRVNLDDKDAKARLDTLGRPRDAKVNANADTAEASAKLDRAARTRKAKIEADVSGLDRVTAALDKVPKGFGLLGSTVVGLGPALIPVTAAVGGLTAALAAPIAAGVGGLGLYGFIAGKAIADTEKQSKAIAQLKKQVDAAQTSLSKASTPAGKKSALATLATDTKAYNDALAKLSPAQAGFLKAQGQVVSAFHSLENTAGPAIFGPLTSAMTTLSELMPKVAPVLKPVSAALQGLLDEVAKSARSGALDDFMKFLAATSGTTITTAGHILGNVALGFAAIGKAFAPLGASLGDTVLQWSQSFAKIGQSKGLADFVGYVRKEGPQVASTLGSVGRAIGHIATALAPLGDLSLKGIDGLAKGVSKIPTGVLSAAALSFGVIAVALKGISAAKGGLSALSTVGKFVGLGGKAGGGLATVEGALGKVGAKGVVPVFVTNEGFGGKGLPGGGLPGTVARDAKQAGSKGRVATLLERLGLGGAAGAGEVGGASLLGPLVIGAAATAAAVILAKKAGSNSPDALPAPPNSRGGNSYSSNPVLAANMGGGYSPGPEYAKFQKFIDLIEGFHPQTQGNASKAAATEDLSLATTALGPGGGVNVASQLGVLKSLTGLNLKQLLGELPTLNALLKHAGDGVAALGLQVLKLPKAVQTKIETPGAVKSVADVGALIRQYHLTPSQVRTLVTLEGQKGALNDAYALGRQYDLTPKQVRTIIGQVGMNGSQAEIRRLANLYNLTPRAIRTLVGLIGAPTALSKIAAIKAELAGIPRSVSTPYYVTQLPQNIERKFA